MGKIIGALIRAVIWLVLWRPDRNPEICSRLVLLYGPYPRLVHRDDIQDVR